MIALNHQTITEASIDQQKTSKINHNIQNSAK